MLTPVGAPIGRSGDFSSVGARVFSAHCFSLSDGLRSSKTSEIRFSATGGFLSAIFTPPPFDDRRRDREAASRAGTTLVRRFWRASRATKVPTDHGGFD